MRISDWSSDVCSSDLERYVDGVKQQADRQGQVAANHSLREGERGRLGKWRQAGSGQGHHNGRGDDRNREPDADGPQPRSAVAFVGPGCSLRTGWTAAGVLENGGDACSGTRWSL